MGSALLTPLRTAAILFTLLAAEIAASSAMAQPSVGGATSGGDCGGGVGGNPTRAQSPGCGDARPGASMSSHLSHSGGTITPPPIDPKMAKTPPESGAETTPVIRPPGTPGGDPRLQPK